MEGSVTTFRIWLAKLLLRGLNVSVIGPGRHRITGTWFLPRGHRVIAQPATVMNRVGLFAPD
jgi:hypothetical protein